MTPETFAAWKERKKVKRVRRSHARARRRPCLPAMQMLTVAMASSVPLAAQAEDVEKKRVDAAKKTGGKGLGALSGRDLFAFDPSLFVDDADAVDNDAYEVHAGRCRRSACHLALTARRPQVKEVIPEEEPEEGPHYDRDALDDEEPHPPADGAEDGEHKAGQPTGADGAAAAGADGKGGEGNGAGKDAAAVGDPSLFLEDDVELPDES